jgi:hypothetical protein
MVLVLGELGTTSKILPFKVATTMLSVFLKPEQLGASRTPKRLMILLR